jgi:hypothetical protein
MLLKLGKQKSECRQGLADWWLLSILLSFTVAAAAWVYWDSHRSTARKSRPESAYTPAATTVQAVEDRPIEQVQLGERVWGSNPNQAEVDRSLPDPERNTWRQLRLVMNESKDHRLDIELLRPIDWIKRRSAAIGRTIQMDLPELGASGPAEVVAIEPCPEIRPGQGNVVTGRFAHRSSHRLLNIQIEGEKQVLGVTDNHPFWSETRQKFVQAGQLQPGELLKTLHNTRKIIGITDRGPPEPVYNLEVHAEHVYLVAASGVLVHNSYMFEPTSLRTSVSDVFTGPNAEAQLQQQLALHEGLAPSRPGAIDATGLQQVQDGTNRALGSHPFFYSRGSDNTDVPAALHYDPRSRFNPFGQ